MRPSRLARLGRRRLRFGRGEKWRLRSRCCTFERKKLVCPLAVVHVSMTRTIDFRSRAEQTTTRSVTCTSERFPSCRGASVHGASGGGSRPPRCLGGKPRRVGTRASPSRRHRLPLRVKKAVRGLGTFRSANPWKWPSANGDPRTSSWPRSRAWPSTRQRRLHSLHSGRRARAHALTLRSQSPRHPRPEHGA